MSASETRPGSLLRQYSIYPQLKKLITLKQRILDVGGFDGYLALLIKEQYNADLLVLDLNLAGLMNAKDSGLVTICASATEIPLAREHMDGVISFDIIEHVINDDLMLSEMARVLKPGGWLVLSTTDKDFKLPFLPRTWINKKWGHVRNGYTFEQLIEMCTQNGLVIETWGRYNNFITRLFYVILFFFRLPPGLPALRKNIFNWIAKYDQVIKIGSQEYWLIARKK